MSWTEFTQFTIIGLTSGSLIALIALGYTLVYGIIELINFAHGEVFMMGTMFTVTFVGWTQVTETSPTYLIILILIASLILAMAFSGLLNAGIDYVAYRRLRSAPRLAPLIAAIGMSFILQNIAIYWHGSNPIAIPQLIPREWRQYNVIQEWPVLSSWLGDTTLRLRVPDLFVIGVTIPLLMILSWFVYKTRTGTAMRATAQDREAAALMGIDVNRAIGIAFILGGSMAGAAGMIVMFYNQTARFQMGFQYGLFAFTAAVLGGIGNLSGAVLGGFMIGLIWSYSDGLVGNFVGGWGSQWTNSVIFGILVLVLVFRPSGLLGKQSVDKV